MRPALRLAAATATLMVSGWVLRALRGAPAALGAKPAAIHAVTAGSPHCRDGVFVNDDPAPPLGSNREEQRFVLRQLIVGRTGRRPAAAIPLAAPETAAGPGSVGVRWLGHATTLVEIDGYRVLTDPVWSERCSPSDVVGPERMHPPPVQLDELPAIDAVVISHDHYDHLDLDTVTALVRSQRAPFVVPLGVGAHLRAWGVPKQRVIELDWQQRARIEELTLVCTPARHFSGRFLTRNLTLWASWAIIGPRHRVFFAGDTGFTTGFRRIGARHGPFDVTLMPVGAYSAAWPDVHMDPQQAVQAHLDVNGSATGLLVPIHWGTFRLAPHPWAEPVERLLAAADASGVQVAVPRPGGWARPDTGTVFDPWWRQVSHGHRRA